MFNKFQKCLICSINLHKFIFVIIVNNVKIFGPSNLPSEMAYDASTVYSKNIFSLMELLIKDKKIEINLQDEIIDAMLVIEKGEKRIKE